MKTMITILLSLLSTACFAESNSCPAITRDIQINAQVTAKTKKYYNKAEHASVTLNGDIISTEISTLDPSCAGISESPQLLNFSYTLSMNAYSWPKGCTVSFELSHSNKSCSCSKSEDSEVDVNCQQN